MVSSEPLSPEGPVFDRQGNLYVTFGGPRATSRKILKITKNRKVSEIFSTQLAMNGMAIHKDGRIFVACMTGELISMNLDGSEMVTLRPEWKGGPAWFNDLAFDKNGNLYGTDSKGTVPNPTGTIWRLDAPGYTVFHEVLGGLAQPNGISFAPEGDVIWVGETLRNAIVRIELSPDGLTPKLYSGVGYPFYSTGIPFGPDGNKVDSAGNLYQAFHSQGRVLILNKFGVPIANVIVPGREEGEHLGTSNLVSSTRHGSCVYDCGRSRGTMDLSVSRLSSWTESIFASIKSEKQNQMFCFW